MGFKVASFKLMLAIVAAFAVLASTVTAQELLTEDQALVRDPRQITFPGPVNFDQERRSAFRLRQSRRPQFDNFNGNQQNFGWDQQRNRPGSNFGQGRPNFGQGRPNFGQNQFNNFAELRRTTRQSPDYEDEQFVFDSMTTRRPGGRPNRPSRPTSAPIRPTRPANAAALAGNQFPFVAQTIASSCETDCHRQYVTPEYNPICGSDGITYTNSGKLLCAGRCGRDVTVTFNGACPGLNVNTI